MVEPIAALPHPSEPEPSGRRARTDRPPATWTAVEALPVALAAFALAAIVGTALAGGSSAIVLGALAFEVALGAASVAWVLLRSRSSIAALGLRSARPGPDLAAGFGWGLALFAVTALVLAPLLYSLVGALAGEPVTPPRQPILPTEPTTAHLILGGAAVLVAAPLGEELFFRGFIFGALRSRVGFRWSAVLSALAFALFHVIPLLMPLMFFVGLGLAALYERRGSLWTPVAAHMAFNLVGYAFIVSELS